MEASSFKDWLALQSKERLENACIAATYKLDVGLEMEPKEMIRQICPHSGCVFRLRCGVKMEEITDHDVHQV